MSRLGGYRLQVDTVQGGLVTIAELSIISLEVTCEAWSNNAMERRFEDLALRSSSLIAAHLHR